MIALIKRVMTIHLTEEVNSLMMEAKEELNEADSNTMEETHLEVDKGELLLLKRVLHAQDSPLDKA